MIVKTIYAPTRSYSAPLASDFDELTVNKVRASPSRLHGRDKEIEQLRNAYKRVRNNRAAFWEKSSANGSLAFSSTNSRSELVLVSGRSGTGKSAVAQAIKSSVKCRGDFFVSGKFDIQRQATPHSAFTLAFTELCEEIIHLKYCKKTPEGTSLFASLQSSLREAIGSGGDVLEEVIPNLSRIIGERNEKKTSFEPGFQVTKNQFGIMLRKFVQVICGHLTLVLFIDDLQWADAASLDLLQALSADNENAGLLIIGSYRDGESKSNNITCFRKWLYSIETNESISGVNMMQLENLDPESVNELVADLLRLSTPETKKLSKIIHQKTHGNAFFVIEFLKSLNERGILNYSLVDFDWKWDNDEVSRVNVTDNVADLLVTKMRDTLSPDVGVVLQVASCLGASFEESMLKLIMRKLNPDSGDEEKVEKRLNVCVGEGFLEKSGERQYRFVHDQIQHASLSLISKESVGLIQYRIGEVLLDNTPESEINSILFIVTDLLNNGIEIMAKDDERRFMVSLLNLRAGKRAMKASAFDLAMTYLQFGMRFLREDSWKDQYELSLELYSTASEVECCRGNTGGMQEYLNSLLPNAAVEFQDKIRPYSTLIYSMCYSQGKAYEAIKVAYDVLSKFSIFFPLKASKFVLLKNLVKTKLALKGKTLDDILHYPEMRGEKLKAMMIMDRLLELTYFARPSMFPLIGMKMVRMTVRYGVSKYSAIAFVVYGVVLCGLGDIQGGNNYGELATSLLKRLHARDMISKVRLFYDTFLSHWIQPAHSVQKHFLDSYNIGMQNGDISLALMNARGSCTHAIFVGYPIPLIESDMKRFSKQMIEYSQARTLGYQAPAWQFVLNLMGQSDDPVVLTGSAMVQDDFLRQCESNGDIALSKIVFAHQLWLSYYFGNYDIGHSLIMQTKDLQTTVRCTPIVWRNALFEGLTAFALAHKGKRRYWMRHAGKVIGRVRKWILMGNVNIKHVLLLLEAEKAAQNGLSDVAINKYQAAIATASRHGFLHDKALANERLGKFYLQRGDEEWASYYIMNAYQLYSAWGAKAIVHDLQRKHTGLLGNVGPSGLRNDKR